MKLIVATALILSSTAVLAEWKTLTTVDEMEGFTRTVHMQKSVDNVATLIHRIESHKDVDQLYLVTGDSYICAKDDSLDIKVKINNQPVERMTTDLSASNSALFFRTEKPEYRNGEIEWEQTNIIPRIKAAKKIFIRIHDTCGTQTTLKFVNK